MSVFDSLHKLRNYWHVIGLSHELLSGKSLKRTLYQFPLLVWRDTQGKLHAVLDVCAHKKAPLHVADFQQNQLVCPYHGWKYSHNGTLIDIPSSPQLVGKLKCQLESYPVQEQDGFIWIYLNPKIPAEHRPEPESLAVFAGKDWKHSFASMTFETSDELLIENLMDATHTPLIHNGLIRSQKKESVEHQLTVTQSGNGVEVAFAETNESVGMGLRWMLGRQLTTTHTDVFLLPNLVKVSYTLNQVLRFHAFIACTPLTAGTTQAFIKLSFRFGWFNHPISWVLPLLARKVLRQDFRITQQQWANRQIFHSQPDMPIEYDSVYAKVRAIRQGSEEASMPHQTTVKTIKIRL